MDEKPEGQKTILNLYAAFGVSVILSVIPSFSAALLSAFFFIGVLIAGYSVRGKVEHGSLVENHATFVIRTMWIAAFLSLITTGIATTYMLGRIDYFMFDPCANALAAKGIAWVENAGMMDIYAVIEPCVAPFIDSNYILLKNALLIAGGPPVLYMVYRIAKGVGRAMKGYRLANPKSWI